MANYSLKQRRMMALSAGESKVTLTLEEVDEVLEQLAQYDRKLAEYTEHLPEDVIRAECEEMFGPRPEDSRKRCVHCKGPVAEEGEDPCCDEFDGSFYWIDEYEEEYDLPCYFIRQLVNKVARINDGEDEDDENYCDSISDFYPIDEFDIVVDRIENHFNGGLQTDHYFDEDEKVYGWLVRESNEAHCGVAIYVKSVNGEDEFQVEVSLACW